MNSNQPKILVVDDEPDLREIAKDFLEGAGLQVSTASDGEEALKILRADSFDCLVSDIQMPRLNGFELLEIVANEIPNLPVVLVTGFSPVTEQMALDAGASALFAKPAEYKELASAVFTLASPKSIWIADDDALDRRLFEKALRNESVRIVQFENGEELLHHASSIDHDAPSAIVLDVNMPGTGGVEVLRELRDSGEFKSTPIFMMTGCATEEVRLESKVLGANAFLQKPHELDDWREMGEMVSQQALRAA